MHSTRYGSDKIAARVLAAFEQRARDRESEALSTDGAKVWSYRTCILDLAPDGATLLNLTDYSAMTTRHQRAIMRMIDTAADPLYRPCRIYRAVPLDSASLTDYERRRALEAARGTFTLDMDARRAGYAPDSPRALETRTDREVARVTLPLYGS